MKICFYLLFFNLCFFKVFSLDYIEKVNNSINTVTNESISFLCNRHKLDIKEYNKIFPKKYFDNLLIPNFCLLTTPKMGTHLLAKVIALMIGKIPLDANKTIIDLDIWSKQLAENIYEFPFCHIAPQGKGLINANFCIENNFKIITIQRDLRDQMIASLFAIEKIRVDSGEAPSTLSIEERLKDRISEENYQKKYFVGGYLYTKIKEVNQLGLVIKFEYLVGPKGRGDLDLQRLEIIKIANYLNITLNDEQIDYICRNLWGSSESFRKGIIGDWKNYFTEEIKEEFNQNGGGMVLIEEGYEKDYNW